MQNPFAKKTSISDDLPSELQLSIKKYAKKDPNSRVKALEEILEHLTINSSDPLLFSAFIPTFEAEFPKWASDPERKVRELALTIVETLMQQQQAKPKMERPILRIIFPLMTCLVDPAPGVSTLGKAFFERHLALGGGKFARLLELGMPNLISGFRKAIFSTTTSSSCYSSYEEMQFFTPQEKLFVEERRIGTAFSILNLVHRDDLPESPIYGVFLQDANEFSTCFERISKGSSFGKRCIFECLLDKIALLDPEKKNFSQLIFLQAITLREKLAFPLVLEYLPTWISQNLSFESFFTQEFEWTSQNSFKIAQILSPLQRENILKEIISQEKKLLPKHFFSLIQLHYAFSSPFDYAETASIDWIKEQFEKNPELSFKSPLDQPQSFPLIHLIVSAAKKCQQFNNHPLIMQLLLFLAKLHRESGLEILKIPNFMSQMQNLNFFFCLALEYGEESNVDFSLFSPQERLQLALSKVDRLQIQSHQWLIHNLLFSDDLPWDLDQKQSLCMKYGKLLRRDWKVDKELFDRILSFHSEESFPKQQSNKNKLIQEFCTMPWILEFAIYHRQKHGEDDENLIDQVANYVSSSFKAIYGFLNCNPKVVPSCNEIEEEENFEFHLKDLISKQLIDESRFFHEKFLLQIDSRYFPIFWNCLKTFHNTANYELDENFIFCAIHPLFLPLALEDILVFASSSSSSSSKRLLYSDIQSSGYYSPGQKSFNIEGYSLEEKMKFFLCSSISFSTVEFSQATDELLNGLSTWKTDQIDSVSFVDKEWKIEALINLLVNHPFLNVKLFSYLQLSSCIEVKEQISLEIIQNIVNLQKSQINASFLALFSLSFIWNVPLNTNSCEDALKKLFSWIEEQISLFKPPKAIPSFSNSFSLLLQPNAYTWESALFLMAVNVLFSGLQSNPVLFRSILINAGAGSMIAQGFGNSKFPKLLIFISTHLSPLIIAEELSHACRTSSPPQPQTTSTLSIVNNSTSTQSSLLARYEIEDVQVELVVQFPEGYPLESPKLTLQGSKRIGVTERQWRLWQLSTQTVLAAQNQRVLEAIKLWRKNADKRFEGVEDCTICCSVFHPVDRTLPVQECKACKQKFHANCLFRWFSTSGHSKCPLCRQFVK